MNPLNLSTHNMASHLKTAIVNRKLEELGKSRCQSRGHGACQLVCAAGSLTFRDK